MPPKAKPAKKGNSKSLSSKKAASRKPAVAKGIKVKKPSGNGNLPVAEELLMQSLGSKVKPNPKPIKRADLEKRIVEFNIKSNGDLNKILTAVNKINPEGLIPVTKLPEDLRKSIPSLKPSTKRFHGIKIPLSWFPFPWIKSPCADKFGYMSTAAVRNATKLPFDLGTQVLLGQLGEMMGDPGRETAPDSNIPAGFTYVGQFVDHDITFDVSSNIETSTDANAINNMRSPALDLDSLYGSGPALDPFLYSFPSTGPATAIRF